MAGVGDVSLELSLDNIELSLAPTGDLGLQMQGCHLSPGQYLGDASWGQLGETDSPFLRPTSKYGS